MRIVTRPWTEWLAAALSCAVVLGHAGARAQTSEREDATEGRGEESTVPEEGAPARPFRWPGTIIWEQQIRLSIPGQTDFDRALVAHGYADVRVAPAFATSFALPVFVEWLWLGGQLGVRGRTWDHAMRDHASLFAVDLLLKLRGRFLLGERIELGVAVGGGIGWMGVTLNGLMSDQVVPRFDVHMDLAIRVGNHFAIGPRIGWDYFEWSGMNQYGHTIEAGGAFLGVGFEGRE